MNEEHPLDISALAKEIEAILFVYGEPMEYSAIQKNISETRKGGGKIAHDHITSALALLDERLKMSGGGLTLIYGENAVQLTTSADTKGAVEHLVKQEMNEELTPAAQETLAVIAYTGPVTRSEIDYIRGVNSSFILRTLLIRGLIDRKPHPEHAHTYQYAPSMTLLKHLGIPKKESLPEYEEFQEVVRALRATNAQ